MATAQQALDWVNKLYLVLQHRRPQIEKEFAYFDGEQPLVYATDQWKAFHRDRYRGFSDNWCGVVGRSPVDRLRIDDIRLSDDLGVRSDDEKTLLDDWKRNEMGTQSKQGFLASTIARRSATIVWGDDNDEPVASWEHPAQVVVAYDGLRRTRLAALKAWVEDDTECASLYLPVGVWKFQRPAYFRLDGVTKSGIYVPGTSQGVSGWSQRVVPGENWPLDNPLGEVPVVEWLNRPMLGGEPLSDIAGTMAMQDAINMLWAYLFTSADYASMPARVVTGSEPPKVPILDAEGQVIGSKPAKLEDLAKGRMLFLPGADAKIAQWDAAKLDVFTGVIDKAVAHVAAQTSTPGHYLLSNEKFANLNGDALTAAEAPLSQKVENQQEFYSPAARDVFRLMAKVRGNDDVAEQIRTSTVVWKDAAMVSTAQVADAATKDRAVGLSLRTVLEQRYGMTGPEIDREMSRIREEQTDPILAQFLKGSAASDSAGTGA